MKTVLQRAVARNEPCPCGSGRRFKDCHGVLAATPAGGSSRVASRSRYRPSGEDWTGLGDDVCDRLGALMEQALTHQTAHRVRDAERLYRAVLEEAPRTHDALHMLGVVRLGLGDFADAERLIRSAMALRPTYAAIETNWSLVQRSIAARDRRGIEIVCEHALPLLGAIARPQPTRDAGSALAGAARGPLQIVGVAADPASDAGWMARRLQQLLAQLAPTFWQTGIRDADGWQRLDPQVIEPATGVRPRCASVVLTSLICDTDAWLRDPIARVLVFVQSAPPSVYLERLLRIAADGARSVTLVFESHAKALRFGRDDHVLPPPIDLAEFDETPEERADIGNSVRVATAGQDGARVAAANDVELLKAIAARAGQLTLLDPGPLRYDVGTDAAIHCVARGDRTPAQVLAASDIYFQRVRPWWSEDQGRMLFGAMARGMAVVCHRESIYAEYIDDGVDGWLYDDDSTALAAIDALRAERGARLAAGRAAQEKARRIFDPRALATAYVDVVRRWMTAA